MQGFRLSHEDAHSVCDGGSSAAFWVLDGHGGDGAAGFCAPELAREFRDELLAGGLPSDARLEQGFGAVDERHRASLGEGSSKASGASAGGVLVAQQSDGSYSLKLVCCGDVCGFVLRSPSEEEASAASLSIRNPPHLGQDHAVDHQWPLVVATVPHRPDHPAEMARIKAAGGGVSASDPPRLEDSLTVSRALGDFEFKSDGALPAAEQKLSCVPDVHEVSGLRPGSLCLLGCCELFRALPGASAGGLVRERLAREPKADLGDLASGLLRAGLRMKCRGDMTLMIVSLVEGTDWASSPPEMQSFEKVDEKELAGLPEDTSRQYLAFLRRAGFPAEPSGCSSCGRWVLGMSRCACREAVYCSKHCQKKAWKDHKLKCAAVLQKAG
uniref:protein-serine/threonine phosphatase n=1 Tax=Alexandrium monilatum TaxID=311494 RepID=A0A7S4SQ13_9DINO